MSQLLKEMSEGMIAPDQKAEIKRLVSKWERSGLLEGLSENKAGTMARLLENQARQLLREASSTGDTMGFQNVAFPIVRRVFGGLIANELVSVQPMSLPSGLLFYLDYRFDTKKGGDQLDQATDFAAGGSLFGDQTAPGTENLGTGGFYNLGSSFSQREKVTANIFTTEIIDATQADISYDPDLSASVAAGTVKKVTIADAFNTYPTLGAAWLAEGAGAQVGFNEVKQWVPVASGSTSSGAATDGVPARVSDWTVYRRHTAVSGNYLTFIVGTTDATGAVADGAKLSYIVGSTYAASTTGALTLDAYESDMAWPNSMPVIPQLDFKIRSTSVTAHSRKLKATWTPELAQDLAAYQNMDAEVELTQVLSEAIALEIDREILADLLYNATGANFHWSRKPGTFLDKVSGIAVSPQPTFTGTVREWYETLVEMIIDVANNIHRKTLRGAANFIVTSPDVATIFEASVLYKPVLSMDPKETMFTVGTEKVGSLNNRFTVYKDPYFPRNRILVGYKGGTFLETGYVYAPYVPLIVTPTIYRPDDFTPSKGVMTRYAKKLIRSDFYGSVTVRDLNVI